MKTKLVTAYWMDVEGYPFQGTSASRKDRYLGSLISHCKNLECEIVCYTHEKNLQELEKLKEEYKLENLTIKLLELGEMKLHKKIHEVRKKHFNTDLDGRGPEIMWGKFDVLERELFDCNQVYWVDVGLQHPGIFPWMYCSPYHNKEKFHDPVKLGKPVAWQNTQKTQYNFGLLFNKTLIDKIQLITANSMFLIVSNNPQTSYDKFVTNKIIDKDIIPPYPIAGMFGGNASVVQEFIEIFWNIADQCIAHEFLTTEEALMKIVLDKMNVQKLKMFYFDVHAGPEHDGHHFEIWQSNIGQKPLYMVWHDILNFIL